jgi:hypothetical protein
MTRLIIKRFALITALFFVAAPVRSADLLVDDFTDPMLRNWMASLPEDMMSVVSGNGYLTTDNQSIYGGELVHSFNAPKPSTFTVSVVINSVTGDDAGIFFCRRDDNLNGYLYTIRNGRVTLFQYTNGLGASLFFEETFDLLPENNKLTVSKTGERIRLFLNDELQGEIRATSFLSGDVSLFVAPQTRATFSSFHMTDQFTEGGARTWFSDNFNGNGLHRWRRDRAGAEPTVAEVDGVLRIATVANSASWMHVDLAIGTADFEGRVEVRHSAGRTDNYYGIVVVGETAPATVPPMLHFGIRHDRRYGVWVDNDVFTPAVNNDIFGRGFVDTLVIKRTSDSFEFIVNGARLSLVGYGIPVGFRVASVGVFCYSEMTVEFDNFSAGIDGPPASILNRPATSRRPAAVNRGGGQTFYDLRGRRSHAMTPSGAAGRQSAMGVYINENGRREVQVRRRR